MLDDEEQQRLRDAHEISRPGTKFSTLATLDISTLDEASLEDYKLAFGGGEDYDWAINAELDKEFEQEEEDKRLELQDVFEPAQLVERMLTESDAEIRMTDIPERLQLARKSFKRLDLTEQEEDKRLDEEAAWISRLMVQEHGVESYKEEAHLWCVRKVLGFLNKENLEVPFIFQHRKDFLVRKIQRSAMSPDAYNGDIDGEAGKVERILTQEDLWDIYYKDLKFRGLMEKRDAVQNLYNRLREAFDIQDDIIEDWLPGVLNTDETQDLLDYLHFQYSGQLKDLLVGSAANDTNGSSKLKKTKSSRGVIWERIRGSPAYTLVRAFGITADAFAQNVEGKGRRQYTEDATALPDDMADDLIESPDLSTGALVLRYAKAMYAEELVMNPRLRKHVREQFYRDSVFDVVRTEKGLRQITEDHRDYEFKYLRNQNLRSVVKEHPELMLRIFKAEADGLVEFRLRLRGETDYRRVLRKNILSDALSDVADTWNNLRKLVLDVALDRLEKIVARNVKEAIKTGCEEKIAYFCRKECSKKLDVAPYKPVGEGLGTIPRVLALSNGNGNIHRDAMVWVYVEEDGSVKENGKFVDLRLGNKERYQPDGEDVANLVEVIKRRQPDVIAVSGFSTQTRTLRKDIQDIVEGFHLITHSSNDEDRDEKLPVVIVNDEVARLYHTSDRAVQEHPTLPPLGRYCVALARFLQNPVQEYASLKGNITSITFHPDQDLLPLRKLQEAIEAALVEIICITGVNLNEAIDDAKIVNMLPYVAGLGPRKAAQLIRTTQVNGGVWETRGDLVGDEVRGIAQAVGATVFTNCASFLYISSDDASDPRLADPLDETRIHPEDYDLARKMCADALDLYEEDVKGENEELGVSGVVKKMMKEDLSERVADLQLDEYAHDLMMRFNQPHKRATLELIAHELQDPHEELRMPFRNMRDEELFTMLTGETRETLQEGMVISVKIRRVFPDRIDVKLDCGLDGHISETEFPEGVGGDRGADPRQVYTVNQTVRAKLLYLDRKIFAATLSLREHLVNQGFRREHDHMGFEWDDEQEAADKRAAQKEKEESAGRAQRVIKHPLFKPFNAAQAEEFLGSQGRGDVVIRPSSKGLDHLAVTWKVADNVYQHIDVLELDKENEFSLGKTLKIDHGKYTYSDLDELIVNHVKAMAKKVEEMTNDERYQTGSKSATGTYYTFR